MPSNRRPGEPTNNSDEHLSRLASVGQIAAGIAHEVKNPLTAVKGFLQLLKGNNPKNPEEYVSLAYNELENALGILENLLQVSKPDLEDEPLQHINLCVELEAIVNLFQDQFYRIDIQKNFRDTYTVISGRKNQFKKAFFNLFKNAIEAIPDKGVISIEHFEKNNYVYVIMRDTGVGIPESKLQLIETPFFTTKLNGTGMGLTQVYSVVYQHGGIIKVNSIENQGTTFEIMLPKDSSTPFQRVKKMNLDFENGQNLILFFEQNRAAFEQELLSEAVNVKDKIDEIKEKGNIDLLSNAYKLVQYIIENREHQMILFAKEEGVSWAKHSLTLAFKLEWVQSIRRVLWNFLYNYDRLRGVENQLEDFYNLEKRVNVLLDQFLSYFFISYSSYKDDLIASHREIIEDLSVPIIPISDSTCILPLIGTIDLNRLLTIKSKILSQINPLKIETLIMDLSGVAGMENEVILELLKTLDGISMMGCKPVITGIRKEIVSTMLDNNVSFEKKADTKRNLQQAIEVYFSGSSTE